MNRNPFVAAFDLWRFATKPAPPWVRKAVRLRDSVRDGAGLVNDLLPDVDPPGKEGDAGTT